MTVHTCTMRVEKVCKVREEPAPCLITAQGATGCDGVWQCVAGRLSDKVLAPRSTVHPCAGVLLPRLTISSIAVPAFLPPLRASTMRGKPPPHALLAAAVALRRRRPHARPSGPRRSTPAMRAILHALSRPPSPCQGQGLRLLVYCAAACRGAMHPPSLCRDL